MIYLREVKIQQGIVINTTLEIFEGNLKEDKKYWEENQNAVSVRYFKLKEEK